MLQVSQTELDNFPGEFDIENKTYKHYFTKYTKDPKSLNKYQLNFVCYIVYGAMVDNSGMFSILYESSGEFTTQYCSFLEEIGAKETQQIALRIHEIYLKDEAILSQGRMPPSFDEETESYDEALIEEIGTLESKWYKLKKERTKLFKEYLKLNKDQFLSVK